MNTRTEWLSNSATPTFYSKEETILDVQYNFNIRRYYSTEGHSISIINDIVPSTPTSVTEQVLIQDFTNPLNEYREDRKIHFDLNSVAQRGSFVIWKNRYWMILTKVETNEAYYSAKITECNNQLSWINSEGKVITQWCFITDKQDQNIGVIDGKYQTLGTGEFLIYFQNNSEVQKLSRGHRFIFNKIAYEIIGIIFVTRNGISIIKVKEEQYNSATDLMYADGSGIAGYYNNSIYNLTLSPDATSITITATSQLKWIIKLDGVVIQNKNVLFNSSDINVALVDANGLITPVGIGNTTITCMLEGNENIFDTTSVEITESPSNNIVEKIEGSNNIVIEEFSNYSIYKLNNGINVGNIYTFSLNNSLASLTNITGNTVTIVAGSNIGNIILTAINTTSLEEFTINIKINSMW